MIKAKVVCDSLSPDGHRLTTVECKFPRIILAEVNTYGMITKSASSNRAIPIQRRIDEVGSDPFIPIYWGKNEPGMVASEELEYDLQLEATSVWLEAAQAMIDYTTYLKNLGVHKQIAIRLLEPFLWQTNVMTATSFDNMFNQRIHKDAQPEFNALAVEIKKAVDESTPINLGYDNWHLPYIYEDEDSLDLELKKKISVARVARTSYGNQNKRDAEKDLELHDRLWNADPKHWAPFEQIAQPTYLDQWEIPGRYSGFISLRHLLA